MRRLILLLIASAALTLQAWAAPARLPGRDQKVTEPPAQTGVVTTNSGLQYADQKIGIGAEARPGDPVTIHYVGTFSDGKKFDASRDRNQPFTFDLGKGLVIKGMDEGIVGMKVGGVRKLIIPPNLGYGERGAGAAIPPNATLIFEVELLKVK